MRVNVGAWHVPGAKVSTYRLVSFIMVLITCSYSCVSDIDRSAFELGSDSGGDRTPMLYAYNQDTGHHEPCDDAASIRWMTCCFGFDFFYRNIAEHCWSRFLGANRPSACHDYLSSVLTAMTNPASANMETRRHIFEASAGKYYSRPRMSYRSTASPVLDRFRSF